MTISTTKPLFYYLGDGSLPDMDTWQAAAHLELSYNTLNSWRSRDEGPPFFKIDGRVRYRRDELDTWAGSRRGRLSVR